MKRSWRSWNAALVASAVALSALALLLVCVTQLVTGTSQ